MITKGKRYNGIWKNEQKIDDKQKSTCRIWITDFQTSKYSPFLGLQIKGLRYQSGLVQTRQDRTGGDFLFGQDQDKTTCEQVLLLREKFRRGLLRSTQESLEWSWNELKSYFMEQSAKTVLENMPKMEIGQFQFLPVVS